MNPNLNLDLFLPRSPELEPNIEKLFVAPTVLSALLNAESTLLDAQAGYGKSTLAVMARRQLEDEWLYVNLNDSLNSDEDTLTALLRQITQEMWHYIENQPDSLNNLQSRSMAVRYFLNHFLTEAYTDYKLSCLADDHPEQAAAINKLLHTSPTELFSPAAANDQRLNVLCDCIEKLGLKGVMVWIDLTGELTQISHTLLDSLREFFDSLYLMRLRTLHIKCLASSSICDQLQKLRGVETLSVNRLSLRWRQEQLQELVNLRLRHLAHPPFCSLDDLIDSNLPAGFLAEYSDAASPLEWLALTRLLVDEAVNTQQMPLSASSWLAVRRAYCAARVPLWLDEQGSFWRGSQLLTDLTPRKRAIYPLVKYLYEHPGIHRPYKLVDKLVNTKKEEDTVDETNLNTMISRARAIIEPFPAIEGETEDGWIYLVTDKKGGGYELRRGLRSEFIQ
ncbi:MAG: hypothetical protein R3A44_20500 [Caldilineaceae bacterium]